MAVNKNKMRSDPLRQSSLATLILLAGVSLAVGCGDREPTQAPSTAVPSPTPVSATTAPAAPTETSPTPDMPPTEAPATAIPASTDPSATNPPDPTPTPSELRPLQVERVFRNLDLRGLTNLTQPSAGDDRLFVTEQSGRILAFADDQDVDEAQEFLDIRDRVNDSGSEEGLLGLAFDPQYDGNGYFYVYYSASGPRRSVVSRFVVNTDGRTADSDSERVILEIEQPFANHNGGQLAFGPDGFLYIGLGDGGSAGDPMDHGQNTRTLLGSILRIDVSGSTPGTPYTIPRDNPLLADPNARPEIWAYGLRNPWRFSFDRETGQLWTGDVGQNSLEEVDLVERGADYGWNTLEGTRCFSPRSGCDETGTVPPVWEYPTGQEGCSVIGGYVYRGERIPSLYGAYVFGDYCSGKIWAIRYDGQEVTEHLILADTDLRIASFGQDRKGALYVLSQNSGIYRLSP